MSVKNPYLIQRCQVKSYSPVSGQCFSDCISLDYMGSSEFEWGIVAQTLSALFTKRKDLKVYKLKHKVELYFLCLPEQEKEYHQIIIDLMANKIQTKEYVFSKHAPEITLWMDLDNQVIFATNKQLLTKMPMLLEGSQKKIEHNRKIKDIYEAIAKEHNLYDIHKTLPGTVALCGKDINDCEGTKQLKNQTTYPVVFWLNGPYINNRWICGFYTVESILEFNKTQTGAISDAIKEARGFKKKGA